MAQLKDDCFAFGGDLMPLADALGELRERTSPVTGTETIPLREANGRILAEDIIAGLDVPPHDNSAVDGYAVFFDDLNPEGDTRLPVTGRVAAGHPLGREAKRGEALRIFTGAPMPMGADGAQSSGPDTIFMEEDCTPEKDKDGDHVVLPAGLKRGSNRRNAGEDVIKGSVILKAGSRLRPQEIGLAASVGLSEMPVRDRLKVAVFSTGDRPFWGGVFTYYGEALTYLGQQEQAAIVLEQAIETLSGASLASWQTNRTAGRANNTLGYLWRGAGHYARAVQAYQTALSFFTKHLHQ